MRAHAAAYLRFTGGSARFVGDEEVRDGTFHNRCGDPTLEQRRLCPGTFDGQRAGQSGSRGRRNDGAAPTSCQRGCHCARWSRGSTRCHRAVRRRTKSLSDRCRWLSELDRRRCARNRRDLQRRRNAIRVPERSRRRDRGQHGWLQSYAQCCDRPPGTVDNRCLRLWWRKHSSRRDDPSWRRTCRYDRCTPERYAMQCQRRFRLCNIVPSEPTPGDCIVRGNADRTDLLSRRSLPPMHGTIARRRVKLRRTGSHFTRK